MNQPTLFELPDEPEADRSRAADGGGRPRLRCANRSQVVFRATALDDLLPEDHRARLIWQYVEGLDFTPIHQPIRSVEGHAGRTPADPKILMALWLYATLEGVGSARELDRLCTAHVAYQWICGDVSMSYHGLSDFRTDHGEFLDRLLTDSVATLMHEGLVTLNRVAQDGMRVRASVGAASFRREKTLQECLAEAEEQVQTLKRELEDDPAAANKRQQAARERAARERKERIQNALDQLDEVRGKKKPKDRDKARVSTTDPDARVMKMADGGFVKKSDVDKVSPPEGQTTVYAPVMKSKDPSRDAHTPRDDDSTAVAEWRARMATDEAKEIYKDRAASAECVNAIARNRGFWQFPIRGSPKARVIGLWYALVHNIMRTATLRAAQAAVAY